MYESPDLCCAVPGVGQELPQAALTHAEPSVPVTPQPEPSTTRKGAELCQPRLPTPVLPVATAVGVPVPKSSRVKEGYSCPDKQGMVAQTGRFPPPRDKRQPCQGLSAFARDKKRLCHQPGLPDPRGHWASWAGPGVAPSRSTGCQCGVWRKVCPGGWWAAQSCPSTAEGAGDSRSSGVGGLLLFLLLPLCTQGSAACSAWLHIRSGHQEAPVHCGQALRPWFQGQGQ